MCRFRSLRSLDLAGFSDRLLGDVLDNFLKSTEWFREAINESCQEGSEGGINKNDFLAYMSLGVELVTKSVPIG
jgi:hypothetical protein